MAVMGRRVRYLKVFKRLLDSPGGECVLVSPEIRDRPGSEEDFVEVQAHPNIERPFDRIAKSALVLFKPARIEAGVQFCVT
jgi:hypothetical protein